MIAASSRPVRSMFCSSEAASMRSSQERMPSLAATRLPLWGATLVAVIAAVLVFRKV